MTKKLIALIFTAACLTGMTSAAFGGSTFMGGTALKAWQFAVEVSGSYIYVNDDLLTLPDVGVRLGLFGPGEIGIKVYKLGLTADIKYVFINSFPFYVTLDVACDFASQFAAGFAIIMDLELNTYAAVYLSGRWRYPSLYDVDPSYFNVSGLNPGGVMFLARFGIELFRHSWLTFNIEGGAVTSWSTTVIGLNLGAMVTWKIN
jgi:hypothetical protein